MKRPVSIKDVARELGVSTTLVSHVMNNKVKEGRVGKVMAQKIREVAERLNYQPNFIARSLRSNKTHTIGLVVADIANPFFSSMARVIEDEASRNGYTVIIGSSDEDPEKMQKVLDFLISRQLDGFIIVPTEGSYKQIVSLKQKDIPFVLLDRFFEKISTNYVAIDNYQASLNAIEFLLKKRYRKIGAVTYKSTLNHFKDRINGYSAALRNFGIEPDNGLIRKVKYSRFSQEVKTAVTELVEEEKVEAIYFTTNTLALEGLKRIFSMGIRIPDELDIMAFDHSEAYHFFHYPIPHVNQPFREMGIEAFKLLMGQMENKELKVTKICLKAGLIMTP